MSKEIIKIEIAWRGRLRLGDASGSDPLRGFSSISFEDGRGVRKALYSSMDEEER